MTPRRRRRKTSSPLRQCAIRPFAMISPGAPARAAQSGLTRVRGAECAQGTMRALRDGLRGHARAVLATSLLHIQAHLYLVEDRRQDGHDADVSRRGVMPPSTPLGALIERAQTTCNSGRTRSLTT